MAKVTLIDLDIIDDKRYCVECGEEVIREDDE